MCKGVPHWALLEESRLQVIDCHYHHHHHNYYYHNNNNNNNIIIIIIIIIIAYVSDNIGRVYVERSITEMQRGLSSNCDCNSRDVCSGEDFHFDR